MDGKRFDDLTVVLASSTRRQVLKRLGGGLAGALAGAFGLRGAGAQDAPGGSTCNTSGQSCTNQQCCEGYTCLEDFTSGTDKFCCPDLLVCGSRCCPAGASCATGNQCQCPETASAVCPGGPTPQVGLCVNLQTDPNNCGQCGTICNVAAGEACCGGSCKNLLEDEQNCGACGRGCGSNETCLAGICCPNTRVCGNTCLVTACDPLQCQVCDPTEGACASTCTAQETCIAGACCTSTTVCGNICLATACDATQCQVCDPAQSKCVSTCSGSDTCLGGGCCPTTRICGNICLATACDPLKCEVCDATMGACVSTCLQGQPCNNGTCGCTGTCPENTVFDATCVCVCPATEPVPCLDSTGKLVKCCPAGKVGTPGRNPGQCNCR